MQLDASLVAGPGSAGRRIFPSGSSTWLDDLAGQGIRAQQTACAEARSTAAQSGHELRAARRPPHTTGSLTDTKLRLQG
ncbi:hypothetical protein OPT61_g9769 [Boeremia exigua]|uniref:Uncharacterized protein n=1 Tax=Boeremia exigua TaxID=749465 RepID=A0ACC2HTM3_9PLEO|nr:hypothetical protein OPT61_g9769 [Boeremia exigua]